MDAVLLARSMDQIVTRFTYRDQIIRTIPASLARLDVMHIEDWVFRLALAPLTGMVVTEQHIFPDIPEAQLWSLLVRYAFDLRIFDLLHVKLCHLNDRPTNRQDSVNHLDRLDVTSHFVLHRRGQPAFRFLSVEQPRFSVARFSASSSPSILQARC